MSIYRDCDTCGHNFCDADDSPCASADDVETGCTGWVPSGGGDRDAEIKRMEARVKEVSSFQKLDNGLWLKASDNAAKALMRDGHSHDCAENMICWGAECSCGCSLPRWKATARRMAKEAREWRGALWDLDTYDGNAAVCIRDQFATTHRLRGILREAASILAKATETHRDYAGIEAVAALAHVAAQVIRLQDETIADRDTEIAELRAELEARAEVIASLQRSLESKRIALANKRAQVAALANKNADLQAVINRLRAGDELRAKGKP